MILLDVGCGQAPRTGHIGIDRRDGGEAFPLRYNDGAEVPDASVDGLVASHVLEHVPYREVEEVVREWVRVLRPGGVLKIAVPDFRWCAEKFLAGADANVQGYVMGGQVDENDYHKTIFDEQGLRSLMESLGLVNIQRWESEQQDCASLPVSLNLQGIKARGWTPEGQARRDRQNREEAERAAVLESCQPGARQAAAGDIRIPPGAVVAVMTMPRLAFTDNMFCAMSVLQPLGITLERTGGVYWNQGMTTLFERHLDDVTRYLLTLDYDTVFARADLFELLRLMETRPEIDALCALQMRREKDSPLFAVGEWRSGTHEVTVPADVLARDTLPVVTGHFGCSLIRVESLKRLPKPWFHAVPDPDGGWGEGRMDADIAFWHGWKQAGLTLHTALRVPVGHLQMVCSWPDQSLHVMHQAVSEWETSGKPAGVWR